MDKFYHSVRLDESLCKGCINCIKRCPTEAIRVRGGKASINNKFCIDCGECIRVCPHHAKLATYDKLDVMKRYKYTVALPAPSLYSQFNNLDDVNIVLNALLLMGFDDVFEVSAAAELVSEATRQYISVPMDASISQGKSGHSPQWFSPFASQQDLTPHSPPQKGFSMVAHPVQRTASFLSH